MKICVVGTGYVGLVSGTCFAEIGHDVICVDNNQSKIESLNNNIIPIYEPRLDELVKTNREQGRLQFTTDIKSAIENTQMIFIAVGTPTDNDGSADLQYVFSVARSIGEFINDYKVIVDKSTVPVGTAERVRAVILETMQKSGKKHEFDVVSNPEFLKEGAAIDDFMRPDRIVVGSDNEKATELLKKLYAPFIKNGHPFIIMDVKSAEITKYAANCMLATRISFMNEIARLCDKTGADIMQVRKGIGSDSRIGMPFLYAGLGYGGSCFPKDVKAMIKSFHEIGEDAGLLEAVEKINNTQRYNFINVIKKHYNGNLKGKVIAVWGLSFKPNTDDMREAPSITILKELIKAGATIRTFDPHAVKEAKKMFTDKDPIIYCKNQYETLEGSDAMILVTEWNSFKEPDFDRILKSLKDKTIFDGRNIYEPDQLRKMGFNYYSIGRV